ncbi:hypothetical protein Tco_0310056, partial [Tanacetum coccineum]
YTPEVREIRGGCTGTTLRCCELTRTCGEIDDRSGKILYMDDDVYDAADGG